MNRLRAIVQMLWMALTVIPWATGTVLLSPFLSHDRLYRYSVGWIRFTVWSSRWLLGIRNRITGLEHLQQPPEVRAVLLVKHQSLWETFVLATITPRPLAYVFKRELLRIPFFGWAMGRMRMIHIDRKQSARAFRAVIAQGHEALDRGSWVIMFPEGTRVPRGQIGTYHPSGALLAVECKAFIIPVAVTSARCWPRDTFVKRPGVVDISIGAPIATEGRRPRELMAEARDWIETEMRRLDPEAYTAEPAAAPNPRPQ